MQRAPHNPTGRPVPVPALADLTDGLRAAWRAAALSVAANPELADFLERRLDDLEAQGRLDQASLSEALDATADHLHGAGLHEVVPQVIRHLLRSVYEFLLAVDARTRLAARDSGLPASRAAQATTGGPASPGLSVGLHHIDLLVRRGQLTEAAASLQALAEQEPSLPLVPVALEVGDRCRDAGQARAASDCYLAAWITDRLDERSLWRLASLALSGGDLELAMSYLRQIVALLEWRGDARGVARVYRKMFILAPDAEDVAARATMPAGEHKPM
jgi:tetratricopeptide (TPR) repeat protein